MGPQQGAEAQKLNNPASPAPPSSHLLAWGGGAPIVSLSGSEQTKKGFLEPLGSPRSPSSVWGSIRMAFL